ncbi:MAG TPA: hypothetical protein VLG13_03505 [Patescibacteria group bacterium]|nr:hypothetical protein [Patescibacteria group bacterium]
MPAVEVKPGVRIPTPRTETQLPLLDVEVDYIDTLSGKEQLPHTD